MLFRRYLYYYIYVLLLLFTAIELSLGASSPYASTDKSNKNRRRSVLNLCGPDCYKHDVLCI